MSKPTNASNYDLIRSADAVRDPRAERTPLTCALRLSGPLHPRREKHKRRSPLVNLVPLEYPHLTSHLSPVAPPVPHRSSSAPASAFSSRPRHHPKTNSHARVNHPDLTSSPRATVGARSEAPIMPRGCGWRRGMPCPAKGATPAPALLKMPPPPKPPSPLPPASALCGGWMPATHAGDARGRCRGTCNA